MKFEDFKKLCDLAFDKYRNSMRRSKELSRDELIEILKQQQIELIPHYTEFIKSQDTLIDKQTARFFVKLLKHLMSDALITRQMVSKFASEKDEIESDPEQWVAEQHGEIYADLEPVVDALSGDYEDVREYLDSATKNSVMLKKYQMHINESNDKIRYLMLLILNNHPKRTELLRALYSMISIVQDLSFDVMIQFTGSKGKIDPLYENIMQEFFNNEDGRALHVVNVFDGRGDFIHMQKWLSSYENKFPDKSDVIIVFNKKFHTEEEIQEMIESLPEDHFLKNIAPEQLSVVSSENINIELKRKIFGERHFSDIIGKSEFSSLYAISYLGVSLQAQLRNYSTIGLSCCMINEVGTELHGVPYHSFTLGVAAKAGYCGGFFEEYEEIKDESEVLPLLSEKLQKILFGEEYNSQTIEQKLQTLKELDLIVGYYQKERNTYPLEFVIDKKIQNRRKIKLIITGHESLPEELQSLKDKFSGEDFSVDCCMLDDDEYNTLMRLLQSETRHLFFATGDNTLQTSLSIGKSILYLNRSLTHEDTIRESKALYISDFISLLLNIKTELEKQNKQQEIDWLTQIIQYTRLSLLHVSDSDAQARVPSLEALDFFKKQIAPYLKANFDLDKNMVQIVNLVERKQPLEFKIEPFVLQKKVKKPKKFL